MKRTPKPHQIDACNAVIGELQVADRTTIVMPCGTGKTFVGMLLAEAVRPRNMICFFPSLSLLKQTLDVWKEDSPFGRFDYLCVCSDETVDPDEAHISLSEFGEAGHVTTEAAAIRKFLVADSDSAKVVFSTYSSSRKIPSDIAFDFALMDEAHRTAGVDGLFSYCLSDHNIRISKRVFMTATPRHVAADTGDTRSFSMSDPAVYGNFAYVMPISAAIEQGIIADYEIIVSVTTGNDIESIANKHNVDLDAAGEIASAAAIRSAIDSFGIKKIITFHSSVNSAHRYAHDAEVVKLIGAQTIGHVNGRMSAADRDKIMDDFRRSESGIVTNARCLTEGVDVPSVDLVVFMNSKRSVNDIVQACGRAMRLSPGKEKGHILLPIHIRLDSKKSLDQIIRETGFSTIWRVMNAMREQDVMYSTLSSDSLSLSEASIKIRKSMLDRISVISSSSDISVIDEIANSVFAIASERLAMRSWDESFDLLVQARSKYNTWKFSEFDLDLASLDDWVETQKKADRGLRLRKELKDKLISIGFPFNRNQEESWNEHLQKFVDTKGQNYYLTPHKWIAKQRKDFRDGVLSDDRIKKLRAAGFEFDGVKCKDKKMSAQNQVGPPSSVYEDVQFQHFRKEVIQFYEHYYTLACWAGIQPADAASLANTFSPALRFFEERMTKRSDSWDAYISNYLSAVSALEADFLSKMRFDLSTQIARIKFTELAQRLIVDLDNNNGKIAYNHPDPVIWQFAAFCAATSFSTASLSRNLSRFGNKIDLFVKKYPIQVQFQSGTWFASMTGECKELSASASLSDIVERIRSEETGPDLVVQMEAFGCDPTRAAELIEAGRFEDAIEYLEEVTGEKVPRLKP